MRALQMVSAPLPPRCPAAPKLTLLVSLADAGAHDNVVGLRGLCSRGPHLYLVMELCPR